MGDFKMTDELSLAISDDGSISISGKTTAKNFHTQMNKLMKMGIKKLYLCKENTNEIE